MSPDRFTIKSQEAIQAAQRLASGRRNPQVAPVHLLLALLEQDGGIAVPVLKRVGVDPESVRARANEQLDGFPVVTGDASSAPELGQAMAEVVRRAAISSPSR